MLSTVYRATLYYTIILWVFLITVINVVQRLEDDIGNIAQDRKGERSGLVVTPYTEDLLITATQTPIKLCVT